MALKRVFVTYGVDVDAVAGWLGSYGGEDSPNDISRRELTGTIGTRRLLKLFDKYKISTTWFIPGHSLETFPEYMAAVRDAGHEIGLHGYSHENPTDMTVEQQRDVLDKTYRILTEFAGEPPRGIVAPCKKAETWMKLLEHGLQTGLVEIPSNWYINGLPPMLFIKNAPSTHGYVNARDYDKFIFLITIQHDVSGRPHVPLIHERPIEYFKNHDGVEFMTMGQVCDEFKKEQATGRGSSCQVR
ncbi:hypothetical protein BDW62DRAFT_215592 [Aspergillus aurantiobrunneus]